VLNFRDGQDSMFVFHDCPECGLPATVTTQGHAAGPVEFVKVRCVARHWFLGPADRLRMMLIPNEPATGELS
jgi:hypothetical protein